MTFIVNQDGVVYQRSLGEKTPGRAAAMKEYNPDQRWTVVQEPGISDLPGVEPPGKRDDRRGQRKARHPPKLECAEMNDF